MTTLNLDKMAQIEGGNIDCSIASAGVLLNTVFIVAIVANPVGWGLAALTFSAWVVGYAGMVRACPMT